MDNNIIENNPT